MNHDNANSGAPTESEKRPPIICILRLLLPPWCIGKNVKSADEPEIDGLSDFAIAAEWGFALIVIVGVILEIWSPVRGDMLVAGGITGEVLASMIAHWCSGELTRRSKVALGKAVERAAKAETETERLREKYAWRSLNQAQNGALFAALQSLKPGHAIFSCIGGDIESVSFAMNLAISFRAGGWTVSRELNQYGADILWFAGLRIDEKSSRAADISIAFDRADLEHKMMSPLPAHIISTGTHPQRPFDDSPEYGGSPTLIFVGPKRMTGDA